VLLLTVWVGMRLLPACTVLQDYDRIMGTNLEASYALCQVMQPLIAAGAAGKQQQAADQAAAAGKPGSSNSSSSSQQRGDASIVFISSVAGGPLAGRSGSLYAISKAGLNQLAASLACEWAAAGIRVNSVAPWVTLTELGKQVGWWAGNGLFRLVLHACPASGYAALGKRAECMHVLLPTHQPAFALIPVLEKHACQCMFEVMIGKHSQTSVCSGHTQVQAHSCCVLSHIILLLLPAEPEGPCIGGPPAQPHTPGQASTARRCVRWEAGAVDAAGTLTLRGYVSMGSVTEQFADMAENP
jgi:hypothetical protein